MDWDLDWELVGREVDAGGNMGGGMDAAGVGEVDVDGDADASGGGNRDEDADVK